MSGTRHKIEHRLVLITRQKRTLPTTTLRTIHSLHKNCRVIGYASVVKVAIVGQLVTNCVAKHIFALIIERNVSSRLVVAQ